MNSVNREQVKYALKTLMIGVTTALQAKACDPHFVLELKEEIADTLENLDKGDLDLSVAVSKLNKLVERFNSRLFPKFALRYPSFVPSPEYDLVKSNIISFEFYLAHKVKSSGLTLDQEEPIFEDCVTLWKNVGLNMTSREGMMFLSKLIQRANDYTPKEKFPLPDDTQY